MRVITLPEADQAMQTTTRLLADGDGQKAIDGALVLRDRLRASVGTNPDLLENLQKVEVAIQQMQASGLTPSPAATPTAAATGRAVPTLPTFPSVFTVSRDTRLIAGAVVALVLLLGGVSLLRQRSAYSAYTVATAKVVEQLDKLDAATETGINYTRYCEKIGDANYEFKKFEEAYGSADNAPYESARKILASWHEYQSVVGYWKDKIDGLGSRSINEELMQSSWRLGAAYLKDAKKLIEERK